MIFPFEQFRKKKASVEQTLEAVLAEGDEQDLRHYLEELPNGLKDHPVSTKGWPWCEHVFRDHYHWHCTPLETQLALVLEYGADPNLQMHEGPSPLMLALASRDVRTVAPLLISKGANPNAVDEDGWTPLMRLTLWSLSYHSAFIARDNEAAAMAKLLIDAGAEVNAFSTNGHSTALHMAATKGMTQLCSVLLENGARYDLRDGSKRRASDIAKQYNHQECAALFEEIERVLDAQIDLLVETPDVKPSSRARTRL